MKKRIRFIVSNLGSGREQRQYTAEESWYWRRKEHDIAECGFLVEPPPRDDGRHGIELMNFLIPREMTELVDSDHFTGKGLRLSDRLKIWKDIDSLDMFHFQGRWTCSIEDTISLFDGKITVSEIEAHQKTLMHGWLKLICAWFNDSIPEISYQLPWWENYLIEEMFDYPSLYAQAKHDTREAIENPSDWKNHNRWLRLASCTIELITQVSPAIIGILKIDRGQRYPALWAGYLWMEYHHLGSWQKVPRN